MGSRKSAASAIDSGPHFTVDTEGGALCQVGATFSRCDVRVPAWQKEPVGRRTVCYCFGENEADIAEELDRTGGSLAVDRVRTHIAAGRCACAVRNPRGSCCLGDVTAAVERMRQIRLNAVVRP
jgi:ribosomal protein S28E/S33